MTIDEQLRHLAHRADQLQPVITAEEVGHRVSSHVAQPLTDSPFHHDRMVVNHIPVQSPEKEATMIDLESPSRTGEQPSGPKRFVFAALVAAAALVAFALVAFRRDDTDSPADQPAPTATVAPTQPATTPPSTISGSTASLPTTTVATPQEFVSKAYDFAVTLPSDWHETDATVDWPGVYLEDQGSPEFANFYGFRGFRTLMVAAATVPAGTQLADWQAAMVRGTDASCSESPSVETTTLGGEPALMWTATCGDVYNVIKLASLHGDRGYVVYLPSETSYDLAENQRIFDAMRESFRFTG